MDHDFRKEWTELNALFFNDELPEPVIEFAKLPPRAPDGVFNPGEPPR